MIDERELLIEDVNFKWLMAGLGCWVDMSQFHGDSSYAAHYLKLAEESEFIELRKCAATLKAARKDSIGIDDATHFL
ncbi:MAG TPA: hypothetical protein VIM63_11190 [Rhodoferax sp.]